MNDVERRANHAANQRAWRTRNVERARASDRAYRQRDPEATKARRRAEYVRNRERYLASSRRYNRENAGRVSAARRAWREAHPEAFARYRRDWNEAVPDRLAATRCAQVANRRARMYEVDGLIGYETVLELWRREPACVDCGEGRGVDHVIPLSRGGSNTSGNLANRCRYCNSRKGTREIAA